MLLQCAVFITFQLDKITSLSRKDRKEKYHGDGLSMRSRTSDDASRDEEQMLQFQQTINRLSDSDVDARFEQMLVSNVRNFYGNNSYDIQQNKPS